MGGKGGVSLGKEHGEEDTEKNVLDPFGLKLARTSFRCLRWAQPFYRLKRYHATEESEC